MHKSQINHVRYVGQILNIYKMDIVYKLYIMYNILTFTNIYKYMYKNRANIMYSN